jgi:hypothetical protein
MYKIFFIIYILLLTNNIQAQQWKFLGLSNENITAIAVDWSNPEVIYAGSGSDFSAGTVGGIFKSKDGGSSWDTLINGVTVKAITIHPINSKIIYVTLGINDLTWSGIIKTTDAGNTWIEADSGINIIQYDIGPRTLVIDSQHPDTLYAGTAGFDPGKLYKSTNGGGSWSAMTPLINGVISLAIDTRNTNYLYYGTDWDGNLYESKDGGITWDTTGLTNQGMIEDIEINPNTSSIIYASTNMDGFFVSTDSGKTWAAENNGLTIPIAIGKIQIFVSDSITNIYIRAFLSGIYLLNNNLDWEKVGFDSDYVSTIYLFNYKLYAGTIEGIYVSDLITSVNKNYEISKSFYLYQNYPNPFNPATIINYDIPKAGYVTLKIYDILGREVAALVNQNLNAGLHTINWDASRFASGIYIYQLRAGNFISTKKMLYLK